MTEPRSIGEILQQSRLSRRHLLQRAAVLGVSMPIFGSLLTACGDDDDDDPAVEPDPVDDDDDDDDVAADDDDEETPEPDDDDDEPDDEPVEDDERYGGRLLMMGHHPIETLHPDDAGPTVTWTVINNIHEPLVQVDEKYEVIPYLATDWDISEDGRTYTLPLEQGVLWHDGEPFTADDVVFSYEWYKDPENAAITGAFFVSVDSVEAADDHTVVVNMATTDASFLRNGLRSMIMPRHHHEPLGYEEYSTNPLGTGPFKIADWRPDDFTLLEAFEDHWRGRPYLDEFEVRIVPEPSVRAIELETGGAHTSIWMLSVDDALRLEQDPNIVSYIVSSVSLNHFPMNNTFPEFEEKVVRQAFMHAINRDEVIERVFAGTAVKATANLAPALEFWYEPDVRQYDYDPDLANQMLEDAGWVDDDGDGIREKNGVKLQWRNIVLTGDEVRRPEAEMVVEYMRAIGADMQIFENPQGSGPMRAGEAHMALFNWTYGGGWGEPDARVTLHSDGGNNFSHFSHPEMDELLERGVEEVDPEVRREVYSEVQRLFAEEVPNIFMMFWDWYSQWSDEVQGMPDPADVTASSGLLEPHNMYRYWLED
jgi:peptide/nickel transport system substrate-binding protein